jgi:two-component system response regulator HydG
MAEQEDTRRYRVLIVDDEAPAREGLKRILNQPRLAIELASDGEEAVDLVFKQGRDYHLVITDYRMPKLDGRALLDKLKTERPLIRVILVTGKGSIASAVECLKAGADDYIEKPFEIALIRAAVDRAIDMAQLSEENLELRRSLALETRGDPMLVWEDPVMDRTVLLAQKLALTEDPVLIQGESGTGKELLARTIHEASRFRDRKFMAINCGALPEDLLTAELFGHEKGAFTGADGMRKGIFEAVEGGTLFLDEIGDLPLSMQAKFLRVLEQKEVYRLGGRNVVPVEFRLVAASNRDLGKMSEEGQLRTDLYYRLRVHILRVPPLRERTQDIPALLDHFCHIAERAGQPSIAGITEAARDALCEYGWPGNVRELASVVRQLAVIAPGRVVDVPDLPDEILERSKVSGKATAARGATEDPESLHALKLEHIRQVLEKVEGNRTLAARRLGMSRVSLQRFLARHPELSRVGRDQS